MKTRTIAPRKISPKRIAGAVAAVLGCAALAATLVWWGQRTLFLQQRAQGGHADAQYRLGRRCLTRPLSREEYLSGVDWLRKAGEAGHLKAQTTLGIVYARGVGVEQSAASAIYWLRRAAYQGDPLAQNELATAYAKGCGVSRDLKKAIYWYRQAASSGAETAERNLALAFATRTGTLGNISTRSGKSYPGASLRKIEPDGITIAFQAKGGVGFAKVKAADLPENLAALCKQDAGRTYAAASGFKWSHLDLASAQM